jgi:arylsulfatase
MSRFSLIVALSILCSGLARAQEVLPRPEGPFAGKIGLTYKDSQPVWPAQVNN